MGNISPKCPNKIKKVRGNDKAKTEHPTAPEPVTVSTFTSILVDGNATKTKRKKVINNGYY